MRTSPVGKGAFMPNWRDCTTIGSQYEQQIDIERGCFRHRRVIASPESELREHPDDGWRRGPAPDIANSTKSE